MRSCAGVGKVVGGSMRGMRSGRAVERNEGEERSDLSGVDRAEG